MSEHKVFQWNAKDFARECKSIDENFSSISYFFPSPCPYRASVQSFSGECQSFASERKVNRWECECFASERKSFKIYIFPPISFPWICFWRKIIDHWIWKIWHAKPLPPQPLGMWQFWASALTGLSPCFLWWDGSCLNPYLRLLPPRHCHPFIQHRLFVDSWTVVFLSHARPQKHRCGRGGNFRVQVSLCGPCGGKEGRYHNEEEEDDIGCRFGNKDKETLESFSVVYPIHTTFLTDAVTPEMVLWEERRGI